MQLHCVWSLCVWPPCNEARRPARDTDVKLRCMNDDLCHSGRLNYDCQLQRAYTSHAASTIYQCQLPSTYTISRLYSLATPPGCPLPTSAVSLDLSQVRCS